MKILMQVRQMDMFILVPNKLIRKSKMYKILIFIYVVVFSSNVLSEAGIYLTKKNNKFNVEILDRNDKKIYEVSYSVEPSILKITNDLSALSVGVGTSYFLTLFYDKSVDKISPYYEGVMDVNEKEKLVLHTEKNILTVSPIFIKGKDFEIKRNFSPSAMTFEIIISGKFLSSSKVKIKYYEGEKYTEKEEVITIPSLIK